MRHFNDCLHWFRDPDGSFMGEDPRLATDEEMRQLKPCADCAKKAKRFGNDPVGPRLREITLAGLEAVPMPSSMLELEATDDNAIIRVRREQGYLRAKLLNGRAEGECSLCGSGLPASLLIAAHIYPRHKLNDAERLDFNSAAMLACGLGCDALFELGYLTVDATGHVAAQRQVQGDALEAAVERLVGRKVSIHSSTTAANFERHRQLHA
ncbi:unannotated protein [freshwater metagenome]|uniref:Unannotated protein n=1 Tax=freshwater metagenome TaxID=449393 RepID=A0A6J7HXX2_9ZZZZ